MPKLREPSLRQQKFIDAYLEIGNATEAAIAAGYKCRSRAVAQSIGSENLLKPMIAARLAQRRAEISAQTGITVESIQRQLAADILAAKKAGRWGAVMSGYNTLLRSIGGMTGERPHPDAIAARAQDKRHIEAVREMIESYYEGLYLAKQGPPKAIQGTIEAEPIDKPEDPNLGQGPPCTPQAAGDESSTVPL